MNSELLIPLLAATVQSGTPILYATLGEIVCEKSGILNLGVEGMMLIGALAAFLSTLTTGSALIGLALGALAGLILAAAHGTVCLVFQGNQVVSGLAVTILGTGLANYFGTPYIGTGIHGFTKAALPAFADIPLLGPVLFHQDAMVYLSYLLVPVLWVYLRYTRWGLRLKATGENPDAAAAAGIHVIRYRWFAVLLGGGLAGTGGAYLSLAYTHLWTNGLSAGRGWIAVALVIFAFWHPGRALLGAYLFGGIMAFQFRLQAMGTHLPSSLLLMLPYLLTVVVLVFSSWRQSEFQAPAHLGLNIEPTE